MLKAFSECLINAKSYTRFEITRGGPVTNAK